MEYFDLRVWSEKAKERTPPNHQKVSLHGGPWMEHGITILAAVIVFAISRGLQQTICVGVVKQNNTSHSVGSGLSAINLNAIASLRFK